ncbi:MAG: Lytic transglycosylase, catalytic [Bryobacterales bacterium]|nr:Lytic transglycosylase, catalytic [Bryobacterales bacterium]
MEYMRYAVFLLFVSLANADAQFGIFHHDNYFQPVHRLSGIGVDRKGVSDEVLAQRTALMIDSQTFGIMRDPHALEGAQRITSPRLQKVFDAAARTSGLPASLIAAVAYLESWGDARAESPAGPKGIMQFSQATARRAGLRMAYATRYRTTTQKQRVKVKGKWVTKNVTRKTPYTVLVSDDRLIPERAVPAAANYLAQMENKFGGRDLAVFAYHCGEGCVSDFIALAQQAKGMQNHPITVPRLFFGANPVYDREVYEKVKEHMARDFSPTYYFRVMRAEQLLSLYKVDPDAFRTLVEDYRNQTEPALRAHDRLAVWLKPQDVKYHSCEDLVREEGKSLARVTNNPPFFGFQLRTSGSGAIGSWDLKNQDHYMQAAPSAVGALTYIAFETRRLFDAMKVKNEKFVPLEVTSLVRPLDAQESEDGGMPAHCTGQVFDIAYDYLPPHEKECLDFVLDEIGWDGYLGFVQESGGMMHIGCAPSARDFFIKVYEETLDQKHSS